jgi:hypothetical protein
MVKACAGILLGLVLVASGGCAGSSTSPAASSGPPANVNGSSWTGAAGGGAVEAPVTMTLAQTGTNVAGEIRIGGRPDLSGPVEGVVQGNAVKLSLKSGYESLPEMTVKQDQISGVVAGLPLTLRRSK